MPVPLPRRLEIARTLRDNDGRPIEARDWQIENIFKALDGFKTWGRGPKLCQPCRDRVGEIKPKRRLCSVAPHDDCHGLRGYKILVVVLDVTRQEGKTTGGALYILTDLLEGRNRHILYLAAAEGQAGRVFDQKFVGLLESRADLKARLDAGMDTLRNPARNNSFIFVPTSAKSIAAGTYRVLFVDEIRDVDPELIVKLLPSILSVTGIECPRGHQTLPRPRCPVCRDVVEGFECEVHGETPVPSCSSCGAEMEEFAGVALLASSAGDESGFHNELVEHLRANPHPSWHLFSSQERLNPAKSRETVRAIDEVLGEIATTSAITKRELHNVPASKGEDFLGAKVVESLVDPRLVNVEVYEKPCVGFLDCSLTTDLASLVLCGEDAPAGAIAWSRIATVRIDVFDPQDRKQFPKGRVRYKPDPELPGGSVQEHLEALMVRFPGLVEVWIDTTLIEDAHDLYLWAKKQPWGGRVREYPPPMERETVKKAIWDALEARALAGPGALRIQKLKRLQDELKSAKTKISELGTRKVMDHGAGDRRGKRRMHRDIAMSLAGCCWIADRLRARALAPSKSAVLDRLNAALASSSLFKQVVPNPPKQW